jgi:hypothetical protein
LGSLALGQLTRGSRENSSSKAIFRKGVMASLMDSGMETTEGIYEDRMGDPERSSKPIGMSGEYQPNGSRFRSTNQAQDRVGSPAKLKLSPKYNLKRNYYK